MTKYLQAPDIEEHMKRMCMIYHGGRAASAPTLISDGGNAAMVSVVLWRASNSRERRRVIG